jgi:glycosyltransferase involved in cell wall biosynthesis
MARRKGILFVLHDVGLTGATLALFRQIEYLSASQEFNLAFLLPKNGQLVESLAQHGSIFFYGKHCPPASLLSRALLKAGRRENDPDREYRNVFAAIKIFQPALVYCNTLVTEPVVRLVKKRLRVPVAWHLHELELNARLIGIDATDSLAKADKVIANSETTAHFLVKQFRAERTKIEVHFPVVPTYSIRVRKSLDTDKFVIGSCGTATSQKGALLFLELAAYMERNFPGNTFEFVWIGNSPAHVKKELEYDIRRTGLVQKVKFIDPSGWHAWKRHHWAFRWVHSKGQARSQHSLRDAGAC